MPGYSPPVTRKTWSMPGLHYIQGTKEREIPYPIAVWRKNHLDAVYTDGQVWNYADLAGRGHAHADHH